jgi:hypothetical protein
MRNAQSFFSNVRLIEIIVNAMYTQLVNMYNKATMG